MQDRTSPAPVRFSEMLVQALAIALAALPSVQGPNPRFCIASDAVEPEALLADGDDWLVLYFHTSSVVVAPAPGQLRFARIGPDGTVKGNRAIAVDPAGVGRGIAAASGGSFGLGYVREQWEGASWVPFFVSIDANLRPRGALKLDRYASAVDVAWNPRLEEFGVVWATVLEPGVGAIRFARISREGRQVQRTELRLTTSSYPPPRVVAAPGGFTVVAGDGDHISVFHLLAGQEPRAIATLEGVYPHALVSAGAVAWLVFTREDVASIARIEADRMEQWSIERDRPPATFFHAVPTGPSSVSLVFNDWGHSDHGSFAGGRYVPRGAFGLGEDGSYVRAVARGRRGVGVLWRDGRFEKRSAVCLGLVDLER